MTSTSPHFDNRITQLLGVDVPIANSPMGFVVKPDLVAAVANAGGIGLVPGSIGIAGAQGGGPRTERAVPRRRRMNEG